MKLNKFFSILLIGVISIGLILLPKFTNLDFLRNYLLEYKNFSSLIYILLQIFQCVSIFIPLSPLTIAGSLVFGPLYGFVLSMIGVVIGQNLAFVFSRNLYAKSFEQKMKKFDNRFTRILLNREHKKYYYGMILLFYFSGFISFDLISFSLGTTKIKYQYFFILSLIGIVPKLLVLNYISDFYLNHNNSNLIFIISTSLLLIVILVSAFLFKKQ